MQDSYVRESTMEQVLLRRLEWNIPVLEHLKDAFAVLSTSTTPLVPILDPRPAVSHALAVADEACYLSPPSPNGPSNWYVRRAGIAAIYTAAELHQLSSPETAPAFLRKLLEAGSKPSEALHEIGLFADFARRGWGGILRGRIFP